MGLYFQYTRKKGEFKDLILNSYHRQCNSYGQYTPIILNKQNTLITIILQMAICPQISNTLRHKYNLHKIMFFNHVF